METCRNFKGAAAAAAASGIRSVTWPQEKIYTFKLSQYYFTPGSGAKYLIRMFFVCVPGWLHISKPYVHTSVLFFCSSSGDSKIHYMVFLVL